MSCWVVPSIAAELWGTSINDVLSKAKNGNIPSKSEYGFMLVDVAPNSPRMGQHASEPRPLTYQPVAPVESKPAEEEEGELEYEQGSLSWKAKREAVALTRQAPRPNNLAA